MKHIEDLRERVISSLGELEGMFEDCPLAKSWMLDDVHLARRSIDIDDDGRALEMYVFEIMANAGEVRDQHLVDASSKLLGQVREYRGALRALNDRA